MGDVLIRIKRAVLAGRYEFTVKAAVEMVADGLDRSDVAESILCATMIRKRLRSTSPRRETGKEYLYVIESPNLEGTMIYTKGKLTRRYDQDVYYLLISSKRSL